MYTGPGSAPMLDAVAAWDRLAVELQATAAAYDTVISVLTDDGWLGPASESMLAAVTPYLAWMTFTGVKAEDASTAAAAAAAAYEAAYAMTVPPAAVAANRAELQTLVATNLIGQNTPAIALAEATYGEMWAQDAAAMYGYATSSAAASKLTPFTPPAQVTNPSGQSGQAVAVTQAAGNAAGTATQSELPQLMSSVPSTLQGLAAPAATAEAFPGADLLANLLNFLDGNDGNPYGIFLNSSLTNGFVSAGYTSPAIVAPAAFAGLADINAVALGAQESAIPPMGSGEGNATWIPAGTPGNPVSLPPLADVIQTAYARGGVTAVTNQSTLVGRLSVPQTWTVATAVANHAGAAAPGGGWNSTAIAPEAASGVPGVPGMPAPGMYGHSFGNPPRYGFRPTIMTRPPAAG
jgi:PPE-repeat protein